MTFTHVFWDWNGTLLDDAVISESVISRMLRERGLKPLGGLEGYREAFGFPVSSYYQEIGFDFTIWPYDALSVEFIASYNTCGENGWALHPGAREALQRFADMGVKQVVLSAGKREELLAQMKLLDVAGYFAEVIGASDIFATGKKGLGLDYIRRERVERAVMIGDTLHDYEVALELGVMPILFSGGHQSKKRLLSSGAPVIDELNGIFRIICP